MPSPTYTHRHARTHIFFQVGNITRFLPFTCLALKGKFYAFNIIEFHTYLNSEPSLYECWVNYRHVNKIWEPLNVHTLESTKKKKNSVISNINVIHSKHKWAELQTHNKAKSGACWSLIIFPVPRPSTDTWNAVGTFVWLLTFFPVRYENVGTAINCTAVTDKNYI